MNNINENAAQQVGENSKSLIRVHSKEPKLSSSTARGVVVNKQKYLCKQPATQELAKPKEQNTIVMDGFKFVICHSETFMHMHMLRCMKGSNVMTYHIVPKRNQRLPQICGASSSADLTIAPYMAIASSTADEKFHLCCVHCNVEFENEAQVLKHGHVVKFKRKYYIQDS